MFEVSAGLIKILSRTIIQLHSKRLTRHDSRLSHAKSPVSRLSARHRDLSLSYASDPSVRGIYSCRYSSGIFKVLGIETFIDFEPCGLGIRNTSGRR